MPKKVFIIHGWGGYPEEGWLSWLNQELMARGFEAKNSAMPQTDEPKIQPWVETLKKEVGIPDENTFFVGHSIGCQTILRYIESLREEIRVGGAVFVAPWVRLKGLTKKEEEIAKPWLETPINWQKVKKHTAKFVAIFSDNDPVVYLDDSETFKEKLGAEIIIENNKLHFSGDDSIDQLPSALESILKISGQ